MILFHIIQSTVLCCGNKDTAEYQQVLLAEMSTVGQCVTDFRQSTHIYKEHWLLFTTC